MRGQSSHNIFGRLLFMLQTGIIQPEKFIAQIVNMNEAVNLLSGKADNSVGKVVVDLTSNKPLNESI